MADPKHEEILNQGVPHWNRWRKKNPRIRPDLRGYFFSGAERGVAGADLSKANFQKANLRDANFYRAWLVETDFRGADLTGAIFGQATLGGANFANARLRDANFIKAHLFGANFLKADLSGALLHGADLAEAKLSNVRLNGQVLAEANLAKADLRKANLRGADLRGVNLKGADLSYAYLRGANLERARLVEANIEGANFEDTNVYGISVWGLQGKPKNQKKLQISSPGEATVTVDDLEVAQFIYLLLRREKLRNVIDTITSKAVLILGRFTPERKVILDAMAEELRRRNLLPIIFDFERSEARDFTETIKILAGMCLFVIADITNPKSAPLELQATVPDYQIPFVPIVQEGEGRFSMFDDLKIKYNWVLAPVDYPSAATLRRIFERAILDRAWEKHRELQKAKSAKVEVLSWKKFLIKG